MGNLHQMNFHHPLGSVLSFLNLDPVETAGSHHTINSGFWSSAKPFEMSSGGVIRIIVDFADIEASTIISLPGQSVHFSSPHYSDLIDMWATGNQVPLNFKISGDLPRSLTLKP
jgi:penicillin G amidase